MGISKTFNELFRMAGALDYDRNPEGYLIAEINEEEYGPKEYPRRLGLYGAWYIIMFKLGESEGVTWFCIECDHLCHKPHVVGINYVMKDRHNE